MKESVYIPPSCATAEKHLAYGLKRNLRSLTTKEFVRAWCSLSYLYPGLHPDGFDAEDSGWSKALQPMAAEAWRRFEIGQITDNELYCYQSAQARLVKEVGIRQLESSKKPWLVTDHFAA